jgi:AraC-like DNA-binding protein
MKFERHLDGCTRGEITANGDIAFLPADVPTRLRPATNEPERFLSYSYLVFEPTYLAELALTNGIGRPLDFIPRFASPDPLLHQITAALTSAPRIKDPAANLFIETLVNAAGAQILRNYAEVRYPLSGPPRLTNDQLTAAVDFIHDHIGESLELGSISRAAGLSEFHFARLFKAATGDTPFQFVTRTRMERAKQLLRKTRLPIFRDSWARRLPEAEPLQCPISSGSGMWSGRLPQVRWTLIAGRGGASSVTSRMLGAKAPSAAAYMTQIDLSAGSSRRRPLPQESETI